MTFNFYDKNIELSLEKRVSNLEKYLIDLKIMCANNHCITPEPNLESSDLMMQLNAGFLFKVLECIPKNLLKDYTVYVERVLDYYYDNIDGGWKDSSVYVSSQLIDNTSELSPAFSVSVDDENKRVYIWMHY